MIMWNIGLPWRVLGSQPEHDQRHGGLRNGVVLLQVVLHRFRQQIRVRNLVVNFLFGLRMHVVAEAKGPEVLVCDHRGPTHHVRKEDLAQVDFEGTLTVGFYLETRETRMKMGLIVH